MQNKRRVVILSLGYGQLSKVAIRGYKSIKKCDLPLKSINILIGSNGAGKSNFISAFTMLQSVLKKELQLYTQQCGINSLFYNGRSTTEQIYFEVFFENNSYVFYLMPTDDNRIIFENEFYAVCVLFNLIIIKIYIFYCEQYQYHQDIPCPLVQLLFNKIAQSYDKILNLQQSVLC